jgi:hypothetical protein
LTPATVSDYLSEIVRPIAQRDCAKISKGAGKEEEKAKGDER